MFHSAKGRLWLFAGIVTKRGRPLLRTFGSLFLALWHRLLPPIRRCTSRSEFWWIAGITVVLLAGIILARLFWDDLRGDEESLSATVRNLGLVKGGLIAIILAVWRSVVGSRQADTAQRGLLNERYQKGAEMLGSEVLSVRLGGIYALRQLSDEHPEQYHVQVMRLFCAFACHPTGAEDKESGYVDYEIVRIVDSSEEPASLRRLRPDVQAVIEAISARSEAQIKLEREADYAPLLSYADLRYLWLHRVSLSGVLLVRANLSGASLLGVNCSGADMWEANFSGARLNGSSFTKAHLSGANLSSVTVGSADFSNVYLGMVNLAHADFSGANVTGASFVLANLSGTVFRKNTLAPTGLTQGQLDFAKADPDNPPILDGLKDSMTGKPLVWRGKPLNDKTE